MGLVVRCQAVSDFHHCDVHPRQGDKMSKWDYLDEEYEDLQPWEPIRKNGDAVGGLTDHVRYVEPNRNGAHKRDREWQRRIKEMHRA